MSIENDLSDEAAGDYGLMIVPDDIHVRAAVIQGFREAVHRAKANPWQLFSDEAIREFEDSLNVRDWPSLKADLERRKAK